MSRGLHETPPPEAPTCRSPVGGKHRIAGERSDAGRAQDTGFPWRRGLKTRGTSFRQKNAGMGFRGEGRLREYPRPGPTAGGRSQERGRPGRAAHRESGGKGPAGPEAWLRPTRPSMSPLAREHRALGPDRYTIRTAARSPDFDRSTRRSVLRISTTDRVCCRRRWVGLGLICDGMGHRAFSGF